MSFSHNRSATILRGVLHFLFLSVAAALPVAIIWLDLTVLRNGVSEASLTEYSEQLLLVLTVLCYLYVAKIKPEFRSFGALVVGFFACLLIRELDSFFDKFVWHGFWVYPASLVAASALVYALRDKKQTLDGFSDFVSGTHFPFLSLGLATLLVFTRLFGMGTLWDAVLDEGFVRTAKNVAEEGTELMAYLAVFYASARFTIAEHRTQPCKLPTSLTQLSH